MAMARGDGRVARWRREGPAVAPLHKVQRPQSPGPDVPHEALGVAGRRMT